MLGKQFARSDGGRLALEFAQRVPIFEVVDESLEQDSPATEAQCAVHCFTINGDDRCFMKSSSSFALVPTIMMPMRNLLTD